ncbi:hypothetical protein Pla110_23730 [Polystyrenella longa]|uniref:(5-formylfuran-3-yl)methyl phosphate synthase n=1 Tax=Polystyrenella longa TaxID=2528007 RepID=A0A518CN41_9PLAN|nr:(5-formylfuran-3-yl)methyl phosphate synthase [Polystyrenella longa]QDU80641.1 hypothetical protein Pla110_23730 [Polystyrenella longa]
MTTEKPHLDRSAASLPLKRQSKHSNRPALLISVRNGAEARIVLEGGVDFLDVKEPLNGPLGAASKETLNEISVLMESAPDIHFSAALGELQNFQDERNAFSLPEEVDFVKLGLSGCRSRAEWESDFRQLQSDISGLTSRGQLNWVAVAYADHGTCDAPTPDQVLTLAIETGCVGLLVDTYSKNGLSTFDFMSAAELKRLRQSCQSHDLFFALAGSIRPIHLPQIRDVDPDIIAVRGAVCKTMDRTGEISLAAIEQFKASLRAVAS